LDILPDIHASVSGEHDADALATVAEFMQSRRFDGYVCLGDLIDFSIISSHNIGNLRGVENGRILEEYRVADAILTQHEKIIRTNNPKAKMVYLEGNHEFRIQRYIDANPALEGMIEVPKVLNLAKRRIEWVPSWSKGELFNLGNCSFHHGLFCNDHHAKKMVQRFGRSILYGHTHDLQIYSSHGWPADNVLIGASLGCLCRVPQQYLRGSPTRFSRRGVIFKDGDPIRLNNHQLIFDGRHYAE
jgi:predicted phosphodiesterase